MDNKKLMNRIAMIESEVQWKTKMLEETTQRMKEAVAQYDTYQIVTFVPGYVSQIDELFKEIRNLEEQKRMLLWIAKEDDNG